MKIRTDFVTNSSGSSFIVKTAKLKPKQIEAIKQHLEFARAAKWCSTETEADKWHKTINDPKQEVNWDDYQLGICGDSDAWEWIERKGQIELSTTMDNFNMDMFLRLIGVPQSEYEGGQD